MKITCVPKTFASFLLLTSLVLMQAQIGCSVANVKLKYKKGRHRDMHGPDSHGNRMTRYLEMILREHSYELSIRPNNKGKPILVKLDLMIESITDISEKHMDLTFTLRMRESWVDERLKFKPSKYDSSVVLPSRIIEKLWVPDLYIVGSKSSFVHKTTVENIVMRLFSNGQILYSVKITTTVACQMNLYNFPLDTETCSLKFQSLSHTSDELILEWAKREVMEDLFMDVGLVNSMPKFKLVHHQYKSKNITKKKEQSNEETVSQLQIQFEMKRYLMAVFFQSYFPALIMVALAGLGMWIDPSSVPARVALGVTSVLTISTIITGLKNTLPKVSYLTAMDIYLWVCFLFVFSTVLEFCVLNFFMTKRGLQFLEKMKRRSENRKTKKMSGPPRTLKISQVFSFSATYFYFYYAVLKILNAQKTLQKRSLPDYERVLRQAMRVEANKAATVAFMERRVQQRYAPRNASRDVTVQLESSNNGSSSEREGALLYSHKRRNKRQSSWVELDKVICVLDEPTSLDVYFRVCYFAVFIIFNFVYWTYYVIVTQHDNND